MTARKLHRVNAEMRRSVEGGKPLPGDTAEMEAKKIMAAYEVTRALISKHAPDDDALYDAGVGIVDDIDQFLKPDEEEGTPNDVTERTTSLVQTHIASFAHDQATVRDALKWVHDYIEDFLLEAFAPVGA